MQSCQPLNGEEKYMYIYSSRIIIIIIIETFIGIITTSLSEKKCTELNIHFPSRH